MYFDQAAFGRRVKELRTEKQYTQDMLAMKLGISSTHYRHIEYGEKGCSIQTLLLLTEEFHVSTDYLLTGKHTDTEEEVRQLKSAVETINKILRKM